MNPRSTQPTRSRKAWVKGLLIGLLPSIAICLLVFDHPIEAALVFTGIPLGLDDAALKIPLACLVFGLFLWTSFKLHNSRTIPLGEQCGMVLVATLIVGACLWIFMQMLEKALRTIGW
jgi:hydrogenase-4 membrane subunit HyfE